jgi:hypothetical protein
MSITSDTTGTISFILGLLYLTERSVMPRRRKRYVVRPKISANEIENRIMALIDGGHRRIKGITIVYVGSFGTEPNWFARPNPSRVSEASMREFVSALAKVRKEFDLRVDEGIDPPDYLSGFATTLGVS